MRVEQPHRALELREDGNDLGVMREVVEREVRAEQVVRVDAVQLERVARRTLDAARVRALEAHGENEVSALTDGHVHGQRRGHASVEQGAAVDFPRLPYIRYGHAGANRVAYAP